MPEKFERLMQRGGSIALFNAGRFFMRDDPVFQSLRAVCARLEGLQIDYAVVGGMSLVAHGYDRTTQDVDILVTQPSLQRIHDELDGLGYTPPFKGSKHLRDATTGVRIEFLVSGQFPGDGKPKPIAFPDPTTASVRIDGINYLKLEKLIELKLASGLSNVNRLKDLADVQELIRALSLPRDLSQRIDSSVSDKYIEFWDALDADRSDDR